MATTTPDAVRDINGSTASDEQIQPYIDAAICLLDGVANCTSDIDATCLDEACTWLTCHLMGSSGPYAGTNTVSKETFENYTVERIVGGFSGKGVLGTTYGQTANALTGGCLQNMDKAPMGVAFFG